MRRHRRGAEGAALVARDPRLYQDATAGGEQAIATEGNAAPAEGRSPQPGVLAGAGLRGLVAGLLRGAQHLIDEALGLAGASAPDAPRSDPEILAIPVHRATPERGCFGTVPKSPLKTLTLSAGAARDPTDRHGERQVLSRTWIATGEPLLSRRRSVVLTRNRPSKPQAIRALANAA